MVITTRSAGPTGTISGRVRWRIGCEGVGTVLGDSNFWFTKDPHHLPVSDCGLALVALGHTQKMRQTSGFKCISL